MSRGPGKWQQIILGAVTAHDWCVVEDLLPEGAKRAQHSAINRAAHLLADAGQIGITWRTRRFGRDPNGHARTPTVLVAVRLGVEAPVYYRGEWIPRKEMLERHYGKHLEAVEDAWKEMQK